MATISRPVSIRVRLSDNDPNETVIDCWNEDHVQSNRRMMVLLRPLKLMVDDSTLESEYEEVNPLWAVDELGELSVEDTYVPADNYWAF